MKIKSLVNTTCFAICVLLSFQVNSAHAKSSHRKPSKRRGHSYSYVVRGKRYTVISKSVARRYHKVGTASWYSKYDAGKITANGERFNMYAMTAASKELPLGTHVRVTNLSNHKSVLVKINDRGPFIKGRIIDLSYAAAKKLGYKNSGTARVKVVAV